MQTTIYYKENDEYLIQKVEDKAERERKSKSAVILSILEEYLEAEQRIGEILRDFGAVSQNEVERALSKQKNGETEKRLGEILLDDGHLREVDLDRALDIQTETG